ncbi:MAG: methyltransferase domain-containing protein [Desulfurococcaceae archaeon]
MAVIKKFMKSSVNRYLDIGSGSCELTNRIAKALLAKEVYVVDIDPIVIELAKKYGFYAAICDLNTEELPYPKEHFDVITAIEVIEHLCMVDLFFQECYNKLKPGGLLLITTPNLVSWINRILVLFGQLPLLYDISYKYTVRRPFQRYASCYGHIKLYTPQSLIELASFYGFEPVECRGFPLPYSKRWRLTRFLDEIFAKFPSLAANFAILFKSRRLHHYELMEHE